MPCPGPEKLLEALDAKAVTFVDASARRRVESARDGEWSLVKHNASRTVYRRAGDGGALYFKHFHSPALLHRLRRRLGRSDAARELRFSRRLADSKVAVPRVLAVGESNGTAWLASEGVEPATPADEWHAEALARGDHAAIRAATAALAEMLGQMHAAGFIHGDLHGGNVLVRDGNPTALLLTDLHRMRRRRRLSRHARAANLALLLHDRRLCTTRADRLRFLKHYLHASRAEGTLRGWVRMV